MIVVTRYRVDADDVAGFLSDARAAIDVLAVRPGFRSGRLGRAVDEPDLLLLTTEWDDVGSYRRAFSAFDVKVTAVPLLSRALDEPSAYEVLRSVGPDGVLDAGSAVAADGREVGLGAAAAPHVPAEPS